jgi:hypothetical protein
VFNLSSGDITVGQHAFFGHNVAILTGTHDFTEFGAQRQVAVPKTGRDVVIGEGAWLASFAISDTLEKSPRRRASAAGIELAWADPRSTARSSAATGRAAAVEDMRASCRP